MCGEQVILCLLIRALWGSPPRVRGTAWEARRQILLERITPACAGNSIEQVNGGIREEDHPRVCGEQL